MKQSTAMGKFGYRANSLPKRSTVNYRLRNLMAKEMLIRVQPKTWCLDFVVPLKMSPRVALTGKLDRNCHTPRVSETGLWP